MFVVFVIFFSRTKKNLLLPLPSCGRRSRLVMKKGIIRGANMDSLSRREFLYAGLAASAGLSGAAESATPDIQQQLLDLAARQEKQRRERFAAVTTKADLEALQKSLRETFLKRLDGLPEKTD